MARAHRIKISTSLAVMLATALAAGAVSVSAHAAPVAGTTSATPSSTIASTGKMKWGAYTPATGSQNIQQALASLESKVGRKFGVTRVYYDWTSGFPNSYTSWLASQGTEMLLSTKPGGHSWRSIATAQPGTVLYNQIVGWARNVKAFGHPMYFTFNHEPEAKAGAAYGTSADFVAAWRHIHDVFKAQGTTNAKFLWIMTGFAFQVPASDKRYALKWYPGDAYVDALGADAGNQATCDSGGSWTSLASKIAGFVSFGKQHPSKELWLPEWDSVNSSTNSKPAWIAAVQAMFKQPQYSQFAGASYFNSRRPGTSCDWSLSGASLTAFANMGKDSFYAG